MMRASTLLIVIAALALPCFAEVIGDIQPPRIGMNVLDLPNGNQVQNFGIDNFQYNQGRNMWMLKGPFHKQIEGVDFDIESMGFDPDPKIEMVVGASNNSSSTQTISFSALLPTIFTTTSSISGAITIELMDRGSDGATLEATAGGSVYSAMIDGASVATLCEDYFMLYASPSGTTAIHSASFGPDASSTPVNTDMAIDLEFTLSPGDAVRISSWFEVIPEPATFGMLLMGLPCLLRRKRA